MASMMMIKRRVCLRHLINSASTSFKAAGVLISNVSRVRFFHQQATETLACSDNEHSEVNWDSLKFQFMQTDYMYVSKCSEDGDFETGQLTNFQNIQLSPSSGVLNYGQALFEGAKAYKRASDGRLLLFRPEENAARMMIGAERMCMPCPSTDQFLDAIKQTVLANRRWIPPSGKGSLYLRPLLFGSGAVLGLAPAPEYTFLVFASPVGNYFKDGLGPLNLYVEDEYHRATMGGAGCVKSITNYSPVYKAIKRAKSRGFSDVLYLDAVNKRYIEEVSSCNIFIVKDGKISTPSTNGTILPGITRKSVIEIAPYLGFPTDERCIPIEELLEADQVFCTGTAVGVAPVGSVTYKDKRVEYRNGKGLVCEKLNSAIRGIQEGLNEDKRGWVVEIDS